MILDMEAVSYNRHNGLDRDALTIDPAKLDDLSQEDAEHLLAALTVHRLRQGWTATPRGTGEKFPGRCRRSGHERADGVPGHIRPGWASGGNPHRGSVRPAGNAATTTSRWRRERKPPEYHVDCGGALHWSGLLMGYDPDTGRISRTWDEMPSGPNGAQRRVRGRRFQSRLTSCWKLKGNIWASTYGSEGPHRRRPPRQKPDFRA